VQSGQRTDVNHGIKRGVFASRLYMCRGCGK
jgi:hypothetical protein